jgi:hypothetical protein
VSQYLRTKTRKKTKKKQKVEITIIGPFINIVIFQNCLLWKMVPYVIGTGVFFAYKLFKDMSLFQQISDMKKPFEHFATFVVFLSFSNDEYWDNSAYL